MIKEGRLIAQGTVADLTATGRDPVVRVRTPDPGKLVESLNASGLQASLGPDGDVVVPAATPEQVGRVVAASGVVVYEMRMDRPMLEDVILELTGGDRS